MMILDLNNIIFSSLLVYLGHNKKTEITENLLRQIVVNNIRDINLKFRQGYGTLTIAADSLKYWRRDFFPYYKASRRKARDESKINWPIVFKCMDVVREEIRDILPYKYIEVLGAEADDIIGVFCYHHAEKDSKEPVLILSSDKDFMQLQKFNFVHQYDPVARKFIRCEDPETYIIEHVLAGDRGDGIPNVLSPDNCLVVGERQKPMTRKQIELLQNLPNETFHRCHKNWVRNSTLIDLSKTPDHLRDAIIEQIEAPNSKTRRELFRFFTSNGMGKLTQSINDF